MSALIILIVVAGIAAAVVVFNKKKQQSNPVAPIKAQDSNVSAVESPSDLVSVLEESIATPEQKLTRKANAAKQASAKMAAKTGKKITKREL